MVSTSVAPGSAADRAPEVEPLIEEQVSNRKVQIAVATLQRAAAQRTVTIGDPEIRSALEVQQVYRVPDMHSQPLRI